MKEIRKAPVEHILWGAGQVTKKTGNTIFVHFAGKGTKEFLYPDAFDKFLVMQDPEIKETVMTDLAAKKEADASKIAEEERLHERAEQRKLLEKALLEAEKRKSRTTARKKSTATAKAKAKPKAPAAAVGE